jgi:indolepyruvate ferredoxin oxidoreductase, beta subunit
MTPIKNRQTSISSLDKPIDIAVVGVGGQGVLTASDVLAQAALLAGLDVKKSELHGMAQRGGSVVSHVRIGRKVHSPVIPAGGAGYMVALERLEALRYAHMLSPGATVIIGRMELHTLDEYAGPSYPGDVEEKLGSTGAYVIPVPGRQIAEDAGSPRTAGTVFLGALSTMLPVPLECWKTALAAVIPPGVLNLNIEAFRLGRSWMSTNER